MSCSDGEGLEDNEFRKNDKNLNKAVTAGMETGGDRLSRCLGGVKV